MRLRKKWWANEFIANQKQVIKHKHGTDAECKGNFKEIFGNDNEVHVEIGCGMGGFIKEIALKNSDINFVAIDFKDEVLINALKKTEDIEIKNLIFIITKAEYLSEYFDENEVSRIYINFCNPWPKRAHEHRRLTHPNFLNVYKKILRNNGKVYFKTDYDSLFEVSKEYFESAGFKKLYETKDLTNDSYEGNIRTEYEKKFIELNKNINFGIFENMKTK